MAHIVAQDSVASIVRRYHSRVNQTISKPLPDHSHDHPPLQDLHKRRVSLLVPAAHAATPLPKDRRPAQTKTPDPGVTFSHRWMKTHQPIEKCYDSNASYYSEPHFQVPSTPIVAPNARIEGNRMQQLRLWDIVSLHSFDQLLEECVEGLVSEQLIS